MMNLILAAVVTTAIGLTISAHALPIVLRLVRVWLNVYTLPAPALARQSRRAELEADLHDQVEGGRALGYRPSEIAISIARRSLMGMLDDVIWAAREGLRAREDLYVKRIWADPKAATMTVSRPEWQSPVVAKGVFRSHGILRRKGYIFCASRRDRNGNYRVGTAMVVIKGSRFRWWFRRLTKWVGRKG